MMELEKRLRLQFEQENEKYYFYKYRWSKGVSVTKAEMDRYIKSTTYNERKEFYDMVAQRSDSVPRRPFWKSYWTSLSMTSIWIGIFGVVLGLRLVYLPISGVYPFFHIISFLFGGILIVHGAAVIVAYLGKGFRKGIDG